MLTSFLLNMSLLKTMDRSRINHSMEQLIQNINERGLVEQYLLSYIDVPDEKTEDKAVKMHLLKDALNHQRTLSNKREFKDFLWTISHLWKEHQQTKGLKKRLEEIMIEIKVEIKKTFSEEELLNIFQRACNGFLLVLIEQNLLTIELLINKSHINSQSGQDMIKFFYPEIRKNLPNYFLEIIKNESVYEFSEFVAENDQDIEAFYAYRKEGEGTSLLKEIIREDRIDEFISFSENYDFEINGAIVEDTLIFETVSSNRNYHMTPIEYSALFGSIQIFKYLFFKEEKLNSRDNRIMVNEKNVIKCAIQGRNIEIIHILKVCDYFKEKFNSPIEQQKLFKRALKCHHNEICELFIYDFHFKDFVDSIEPIMIFNNYQLFSYMIEKDLIDIFDINNIMKILAYSCQIGNEEIVQILINQQDIDINTKDRVI